MKLFSKKILSLMLVCILAFSSLFVLTAYAENNNGETNNQTGEKLGSIHVLNTGWEDAIILESGGHYALVDSGEPGRGPYIVDYLQRLSGNDEIFLDFVVGTHSHIDHMGGFDYILNDPNISVGKAYAKKETRPSRFYNEFAAACEENDIDFINEELEGVSITLGNMKITLLNGAPLATGGTTNEESICQFIELGDFKALLAGDMVTQVKEMDVANKIGGTIDFLKVGHHGQRDSTGKAFANSLSPKLAVYTSGSSWETNSHDVTLGVKKGVSGYNNLAAKGTFQYVTTDIGGLFVEIYEDSVSYGAIKEFTKKGETLEYEYREDTEFSEMAVPELTFFEQLKLYFEEFFQKIKDFFTNLFGI